MIEHKTTTTNVLSIIIHFTKLSISVHFIKVPYFHITKITKVPYYCINVNGLRRLLIKCLLIKCLLIELTHSSTKKHDRKSHALLR